MSRKAPWEDASDLGPYAKSGGPSWGRVFILVLLIAVATFVAAYYLPLYRAQQKLAEQYRDLSQQSQGLAKGAQKAQSELKNVTSERDQLQAEHDRRESAQKTQGDKLERTRTELSSKLDKLVKKGSAVVVTAPGGGSILVALDAAALFLPSKLDLSPGGEALMCEVAKSAQSFTVSVSDTLSKDVKVPAALEASFGNPWALSAARAAAVAHWLEDKCALLPAQLSATGDGKYDPFSAQLPSLKGPEHVVVELSPH